MREKCANRTRRIVIFHDNVHINSGALYFRLNARNVVQRRYCEREKMKIK
jgi:hypothetical protein